MLFIVSNKKLDAMGKIRLTVKVQKNHISWELKYSGKRIRGGKHL